MRELLDQDEILITVDDGKGDPSPMNFRFVEEDDSK